ncbi:hypothetical protein FACS1894189_6820 [Planctomycetales bacterium]|nr:hypothetical protein FACS1894189_6820 [Planctomycetales bacterium]
MSEIILTVIDDELYKQGWRYVRKIDDYDCYTKTYEESQHFIVELNKQLHEFGLTLNHKKTSILELPQAAETKWVRKINAFDLGGEKEIVNYKKARALLDLAIELMHANNSQSSILNYTIKILHKRQLTVNAQTYCAKTMLHLAFIYPYLVSLLDEFVFVPYLERKYKYILEFSNNLLIEEMKRTNYEAVCYAIFFAIKYRFELNALKVDDIIGSKNCIALLLTYLYFSQRQDSVSCKKLKDYAKTLKNDEFDQNWLFAYEVLTEGLLKDEWKPMKKAGVSFVDKTTLNIP